MFVAWDKITLWDAPQASIFASAIGDDPLDPFAFLPLQMTKDEGQVTVGLLRTQFHLKLYLKLPEYIFKDPKMAHFA